MSQLVLDDYFNANNSLAKRLASCYDPINISRAECPMFVTMLIGDELAKQLEPYESQFSEIVELGLRELRARSEAGYHGVRGVLETLAALPTPQEVLALRPGPALQERIDALLEKNRTTGFSTEDQREWDHYQDLEHLVRLAKATAIRKLNESKAS